MNKINQLEFSEFFATDAVSMREMNGDDYSFLRQKTAPAISKNQPVINVADLFCGVGGISLGILEACRTMGFGFQVSLAIDNDKSAAKCFKKNFSPLIFCDDSVADVMHMPLGSAFSEWERTIASRINSIDLLVGGPPCQGHSDLNNSTRRKDPKNSLYLYMARAAEILKPQNVLIENVVGAVHDKNGVVQETATYLSKLGYNVSVGLIDLSKIGVPQKRKRLIVLGSKNRLINVKDLEKKYGIEGRSIEWAIGDLTDVSPDRILDTPAVSSKDNKRRMEFLFQNDLHDLPNEQRPPCHRNKKHTYSSVYGRLRWNLPAQTITSGFYCMCMGRYVHPILPRTLTAHEAARLQFFPDYFDFSTIEKRTHLAQAIGNAVPSKLSYIAALELFNFSER